MSTAVHVPHHQHRYQLVWSLPLHAWIGECRCGHTRSLPR